MGGKHACQKYEFVSWWSVIVGSDESMMSVFMVSGLRLWPTVTLNIKILDTHRVSGAHNYLKHPFHREKDF